MRTLGRLAADWRWVVVLVWVLAAVGVQVAATQTGGDFRDVITTPGTDSQDATDLLERSFPSGSGDADTIVWRSQLKGGALADSSAAVIETLLQEVRSEPSVVAVQSPFDDQAADAQVSPDGRTAFATIQFNTKSFEVDRDEVEAIVNAVEDADEVEWLEVGQSGQVAASLATPEVGATELVGVVVAAIVLYVMFGSVLAMLLPLITAAAALSVGIGGIRLLSNVMDIPEVGVTIGVLLGLGVGIDYALFIVHRHRRALRSGTGVRESIAEAIDSSGRAVLFAGATVIVALLGLTLVGLDFLAGIGVEVAIAVLLTALAAVTLLPALLALLGIRVLPKAQRQALESGTVVGAETRHRQTRGWVRAVTSHGAVSATLGIVVMLVLAIPVLDLRLGTADQGSDPDGTVTRTGYDLLADGYGAGANGPLLVTASTPDDASRKALPELSADLESLPGVQAVGPAQESADGTAAIIQVTPETSPQAEATVDLIEQIRTETAVSAEQGAAGLQVHVGGPTAVFNDFAEIIADAAPIFYGAVIGLSMLLLILAFRSLLVPAIGAVMNLLSAAVAFGAMVAVFQWGWGAELLGVGKEGPIEPFIPIIAFAILFGLSTDYQVFLVSRMHEEWVRTRDNRRAVTVGLAETGPVITAAALIMVSVFGAFVAGDSRVIKLVGATLAFGVAMDAFLVRQAVVPAVMSLLGRANWWLPQWLDRLLARLSIEGATAPAELIPWRADSDGDSSAVDADRAKPVSDGAATGQQPPAHDIDDLVPAMVGSADSTETDDRQEVSTSGYRQGFEAGVRSALRERWELGFEQGRQTALDADSAASAPPGSRSRRLRPCVRRNVPRAGRGSDD